MARWITSSLRPDQALHDLRPYIWYRVQIPYRLKFRDGTTFSVPDDEGVRPVTLFLTNLVHSDDEAEANQEARIGISDMGPLQPSFTTMVQMVLPARSKASDTAEWKATLVSLASVSSLDELPHLWLLHDGTPAHDEAFGALNRLITEYGLVTAADELNDSYHPRHAARAGRAILGHGVIFSDVSPTYDELLSVLEYPPKVLFQVVAIENPPWWREYLPQVAAQVQSRLEGKEPSWLFESLQLRAQQEEDQGNSEYAVLLAAMAVENAVYSVVSEELRHYGVPSVPTIVDEISQKIGVWGSLKVVLRELAPKLWTAVVEHKHLSIGRVEKLIHLRNDIMHSKTDKAGMPKVTRIPLGDAYSHVETARLFSRLCRRHLLELLAKPSSDAASGIAEAVATAPGT